MSHLVLPSSVENDLSESLELDVLGTKEWIDHTTTRGILKRWLEYQGVSGYTDDIIDIIKICIASGKEL